MKKNFKLKRPLREYCDGNCDSPFEWFMLLVIFVNVISLGLGTVRSLKERYISVFYYVDLICLIFFVIELLVKIIAFNKDFFGEKRPGPDGKMHFKFNRWNIFDFVIVVVSVFTTVPYFALCRFFRVFRSVRVFRTVKSLKAVRVFKLVNNFENLRVIFKAILNALPSILWTAALLFVFMYSYAIIGTYLLADDYPDLFGNLGKSLVSLVQMMTFDSWISNIVRPILKKHPYTVFYFFSYAFISALVIMNVIIGIVVNSVEESRCNFNEAKRKADEKEAMEKTSKENIVLLLKKQLDDIHKTIELMEAFQNEDSQVSKRVQVTSESEGESSAQDNSENS